MQGRERDDCRKEEVRGVENEIKQVLRGREGEREREISRCSVDG
jgi:hypothetical protein